MVNSLHEDLGRVDAVVVGAGVVGLACARALARQGREVIVLERHPDFGRETSARNSEVLHAGFYYPTDSIKARLCVRGHALLSDYCQRHAIAMQTCGKLVVAQNPQQEAELARLLAQGEANGVAGLRLMGAQAAQRMEPALRCTAALHSSNTGILDSHALMRALLGEAEAHGASLARLSPLLAAWWEKGEFVLEVGRSAAEKMAGTRLPHLRLRSRVVINAAGLGAQAVAAALVGFPSGLIPKPHLAKGNYYALAGRAPFRRLIYPVPETGGLGVHLTLDLGGQARFGPDVEWLAPGQAMDYHVDPARAANFYREIRRYWPDLPDAALTPAFCGIRPKISGPGETAADFCIQDESQHGLPGWINLFGIESPGLTASLAIAELVVGRVA